MKQPLRLNKQFGFNLNSDTSTIAKGKTMNVHKKDGYVIKVHQISCIKPFLYEAKEWDKNDPTQILKTTEGRSKLDNKMFILQGDETSKQFMLWLKNYDNKINKNILISSVENLAFLKPIVDKEAQKIMSKVERNFELYTKLECIDIIHNHRI